VSSWSGLLQTEAQHITVKPLLGNSPEAELDALAAVYRYVLFDSQASKGGPHDLTNNLTEECARLDQKGKDNADVHGDGV
jgi:hypothetical protein